MLRKSIPVFNPISPSNIDAANGVIKNVVIINSGEDKIGDNIDSTFLKQIAEQGNAQSQGVKSRFGHPNFCDDALGTYIGRYKNFQVNDTSVTADLYLDSTAKISPKGNLHDYILEFAQKNDDMFGNSIVFRQGESEIRKVKSDSGEEVEKEFIRLDSLVASDLVDSPAATNSLFKSDDDFAAKATEFLNDNEEIFERIVKNPKVLAEFLIKYTNYKSQKSLVMKEESKSESILTNIQKSLGELKEKIFGKSDTKAILDVATADGTILHVDDTDNSGSPQVNDAVTIDGKTNPDGSYPMPDGNTIVVNGGVIASIGASAAPPPPPPAFSNDEILQMKYANEALKSEKEKWAEEKIKLESDLKEKSEALVALENKVAEVEKEFTEFKSTIKSKYKPEDGATGSAQERKEKLTGKEKDENRFSKESREERRAKYTGSKKIPDPTLVN